MANKFDNAPPLVRLAVAILDDEHGITEAAFEQLKKCRLLLYSPHQQMLDELFGEIEGCDGRVFLPEGWEK